MTDNFYDSDDTYDGVGASALTGNDWIHRTRGLLLSGLQAERNSLVSPYTAGSGVLAFSSTLGGITTGVRLSIGLNTFYVRSVNVAASTATVFGGQEGTTDTSAAAGDLVLVAPSYTDFEILWAINSELAALSGPDAGLFQVATADLTFTSGAIGYDLTELANLIDVLEVRYVAAGSGGDTPRLTQSQWRLNRLADTAVFPSGNALEIWGPAVAGRAVRVVYRAGFTAMSDPALGQDTTGLPQSAWDIPPMGAAIRLAAPREIKRNQTEGQPDARRVADVPAGAVAGSVRGLAALRAERVNAEKARLLAHWPHRRW